MCKNCRDYNNNSCTDILSTNCSRWEGEKYDQLDICINDSLTEVQTSIILKIIEILKGKDIVINDIDFTDCDYLNDLLGEDEKNLINILNIYKDSICQINTSLSDIKTNSEDYSTVSNYVLGCIALLPSSCEPQVKFKTLIQAVLNKLCELNTKYSNIANLILETVESATGDFMCDVIKSCGNNGITYSGSGSNTKITFEALVPPNCPIIYTGSTSLFNSSGAGLPNTIMCGWYLCNGQNNTPVSTSLPQNGLSNIVYIIRFT